MTRLALLIARCLIAALVFMLLAGAYVAAVKAETEEGAPAEVVLVIPPAEDVPAPSASEEPRTVRAADWLDHRIYALALCESGGNPYAVGQGIYLGWLQFEPRTWQETKQRMGRPDLDVWNAAHQAEAARWLIERGESWRWRGCW